jgi:hypothetical protein
MLSRMSRVVAVWCACVLSLAQGCSLIFVSGPPREHERLRYFDCVSNGAAPAGDASWAVFDGLLAAALASADDDDGDGSRNSVGTAAALFGVAAAIHTGSMIYGLVQADSCSDAKQLLQQRIADGDAEHTRRIEELERQLSAQQAAAVPAPAAPRTLELAPLPDPQAPPAAAPPVSPSEVPPPPGTYTQPPPSSAPAQPAPAQPAPARPAPAQP